MYVLTHERFGDRLEEGLPLSCLFGRKDGDIWLQVLIADSFRAKGLKVGLQLRKKGLCTKIRRCK